MYPNIGQPETAPAAAPPSRDLPPPPDARLIARANQAYAQQTRQRQDEQWIVGHLPLVRHIVLKVVGNLSFHNDLDDLISAGTLGLVRAARAFDPSREVDFKTYAYIRIRGAVIDELRGRSFLPAGVHKEVRRLKDAYQQHSANHGRPPTDEELAEAMGVPLAGLYRMLAEARKQNFLSIHGLGEEDSVAGQFHPASREPSPVEQAERKETLEGMTQAIRELPERDRLVVLLYYDRDLTMKEAAQVLGVTESRFSQLHSSAVFKLSMKMGVRR